MKTTDPRDPLDQKIDALLASQPTKAPADFSARVLAEVNAEAESQNKRTRTLPRLIRFALPLAAAIALALVVVYQLGNDSADAPTHIAGSDPIGTDDAFTSGGEALNDYEIQELLLLEDGLSGFAQIESEGLNSDDLLDTLDTLYSI